MKSMADTRSDTSTHVVGCYANLPGTKYCFPYISADFKAVLSRGTVRNVKMVAGSSWGGVIC